MAAIPFSFFIFATTFSVSIAENFLEELFIKPVGSTYLYTYFQFVTLLDRDVIFDHSNLLPRPLGEVIQQFQIDELHLTLTEGQWRHEQWGFPITDAAPGAELYAWFSEKAESVDDKWRKLAETLSGLYCASLNFIDASNTISPEITFYPSSPVQSKNFTNSRLRYASLPREIVCTENLTPWKKLLPCESERGLAALLNSRMIHNTNYHSIGVHFRKICADQACDNMHYELKQTVSLVYDLEVIGGRDWSFRKLFGHGLPGRCPLADSAKVYVDVTSNTMELTPPPHETVSSSRGGADSKYAVYNIDTSQKFVNIAVRHRDKEQAHIHLPPPVHFSRYSVGYGQENGGIKTEITNNHFSAIKVVLMENIPWWLPVHLSSLRVNGEADSKLILKKIFKPGRSRVRPYNLELLLILPPKSTTVVSIGFEFIFLKWQEYPPDANHAFYVGSAVISMLLPSAKNYTSLPLTGSSIDSMFNASQPYYIGVYRSQAVAVSLPTPDFSMPYNVICLACTIVALAFGPLHNICTKRLMLQAEVVKKSLFQRVISFFKKDKEKTE